MRVRVRVRVTVRVRVRIRIRTELMLGYLYTAPQMTRPRTGTTPAATSR